MPCRHLLGSTEEPFSEDRCPGPLHQRSLPRLQLLPPARAQMPHMPHCRLSERRGDHPP